MLFYPADFTHLYKSLKSIGFQKINNQQKEEEMTATEKTRVLIGRDELHRAVGKGVLVPSHFGMHVGGGFREFPLANVVSPHPMLGADCYTEAFFTTRSGNLYRIFRAEDRFGCRRGEWTLVNGNLSRGRSPEAVTGYIFAKGEAEGLVLRVGEPFRYGTCGCTTALTAILAMNAGRATLNTSGYELETNIREEFFRMVAGDGGAK